MLLSSVLIFLSLKEPEKTSHLNVLCQVDALRASLVQFQTSKEIVLLLQTAGERISGNTHKSGEGALFLSFTSITAIPGTQKDLPVSEISPNSYCTVTSNASYYLFLRFLFPICCSLHPLPDSKLQMLRPVSYCTYTDFKCKIAVFDL